MDAAAVDSVRTHERHEGRIAALEKSLSLHVETDAEMHKTLLGRMDEALHTKTSILTAVRVIAVLFAIFGATAILGGAKWVLQQALREELIEQGLVRIEHAR